MSAAVLFVVVLKGDRAALPVVFVPHLQALPALRGIARSAERHLTLVSVYKRCVFLMGYISGTCQITLRSSEPAQER